MEIPVFLCLSVFFMLHNGLLLDNSFVCPACFGQVMPNKKLPDATNMLAVTNMIKACKWNVSISLLM